MVLIIGILAAVAVPQYQKAVVRSQLSTLKNLVNAMKQSEEMYYLANGSYTSSFEDLEIEIPTPNEYSTEDSPYNSIPGGYSYANYDWGMCYIYRTTDDSNAHVACKNTKVGISYVRGLDHSIRYRGEQMCTSRNKMAQSVCLAETHNNTPYYSDEENQIWNYYYRN